MECVRIPLGKVATYQCKTDRGVLGLLCPAGSTRIIAVTCDMQIARVEIDVDGKLHLYMQAHKPDYENFLMHCVRSSDGTRLVGFIYRKIYPNIFPDRWVSVHVTRTDVVVIKHDGILDIPYSVMLTSCGTLYAVNTAGTLSSLLVDHTEPVFFRRLYIKHGRDILVPDIIGPVWCQRIDSFIFAKNGLQCAKRTQSEVFELSDHAVAELPYAELTACSYLVMSADDRWLAVPIVEADHISLVVLEVAHTPQLKFTYKTTVATTVSHTLTLELTYLVSYSTLNPSVMYYLYGCEPSAVRSINLDSMTSNSLSYVQYGLTRNSLSHVQCGIYNVAGFIMPHRTDDSLYERVSRAHDAEHHDQLANMVLCGYRYPQLYIPPEIAWLIGNMMTNDVYKFNE